MKQYLYYVYILTSRKNGTLYVGVTSDLQKRTYQHKNKIADGFTKKYDVNKLVYFEIFNNINLAIKREKQLKGWKREYKITLIEKENKFWKDLSDNMVV